MTYVIRTRVVAVGERSAVQGVYPSRETDTYGKPISHEEVTRKLGWFVRFEDSWESLYLGDTAPVNDRGEAIKIGDTAEIRVRFP